MRRPGEAAFLKSAQSGFESSGGTEKGLVEAFSERIVGSRPRSPRRYPARGGIWAVGSRTS